MSTTSICRTTSSNQSSSPSLLEKIYDVTINTLSTETSKYTATSNEITKNSKKCCYCPRILLSGAGKARHERIHLKQEKKKKKEKSRKTMKQKRRSLLLLYSCQECSQEFPYKASLTKHLKKHIPPFKCEICNGTFKDKMDYEWHDSVICDNVDDGLSPGFRTRSRSRMSQSSRMSCRYLRKRARSCDPVMSDVSLQGDTSGVSVTRMSFATAPHKRIRHYTGTDTDAFTEDGDLDFYDNDNDDIITDKEESEWADFMNSVDHCYEKQVLVCSINDCDKIFADIDWLTLHEIHEHNKLALYRCNECRKRYTTRENLEKHMECHYKFLHIQCVLCNVFQLGKHIVSHSQAHLKSKQKILCERCGMQFLDTFTYNDHQIKPHFLEYPKKTRVLYRIQYCSERKITLIENLDPYMGDYSFNSLFDTNYVDFFDAKFPEDFSFKRPMRF